LSDEPIRILIIDDESGILDSLRILFKGEGFDVSVAHGGKAGLKALETEAPELVLSDIRMPGATGLDILRRAREIDANMAVILMTAQASLQSAVEAVNEGAYYYLQKPFANEELLAICRRASEARRLKAENRKLKKQIRQQRSREQLRPTGKARSFVEVLKLAETVAPTESTVLISGESGTGKEVLSRFIHDLSDRADQAFFSINCGALTESLLESELFGHVKGAFTGAVAHKDGLLVAAKGGTFFLDEIGELTPATQVKLLRCIQEREVIPVGSTEAVSIDVRLIAATNRDLEEEIRRGRFRNDLYYRLNVIALHMPPLRERKDDIPLLAHHFLAQMAEQQGLDRAIDIDDEAMDLMLAYDWPGNVRELQNALERAAVVGRNASVHAPTLPERLRNAPTPRLVEERLPDNPTMEVIERAYINWVLSAESGNKSRAAEVLGIDPSTLYRKLNRYGLETV